MVEDLDNPLTVHMLFYISGHICQVNLLADKILAAVSAYISGHYYHKQNHQNSQCCKYRTQKQHRNKSYYNSKTRHKDLRDGLVDHLPQSISIICVKTHDRAVGILIKVADRKGLHMFKHFISDLLQHALADHNHHTVVYKTGNDTQYKNAGQNRHSFIQFREIRILLSHQRQDIIVQ